MYKKISCLSVALLVAMHVDAKAMSWQRQDVTQPLPKKPTTVLLYIAGDNSLADFIHLDIEEAQKVGSNENVNILAYVSSSDSSGKWTRALVVNKGQSLQDGADMDKDSGSAQTAIDAIDWATGKFPSDNFMIVFWNHGSGSLNRSGMTSTFFGKPWGTADRAFCYDDSTGSYFTDQDLRAVLAHAVDVRGKAVDVVAFDACLMANVEVAYAVQAYAKYLVASEQTIPGEGYPYNTALSMAAQPNLSIVNLVKDMVKDYGVLYQGTGDYTLSGTDLSMIPALKNTLDALALNLTSLLNSRDWAATKQAISKSANPSACTYFTETTYIDLGHFLANLKTNIGKARITNKQLLSKVNSAISSALTALRNCIVAQVKGSKFPKATGLSIYMERHASLDPDYASTQWAQDSNWATFLEAYVAN